MLTFPRKVQVVERVRRSEAQNLADRARKYVAQMPPAVSGQGGHAATFAVAMTLIHGFALPEPRTWPILLEYNARCLPPWSERELRHKLASAGKLTRPCKPRGHLLAGDDPPKCFLVPPKPERTTWQVEVEPLPGKDPQAEQVPTPEPKTAPEAVPDDYPRRQEETERLLRESRPITLANNWPAINASASGQPKKPAKWDARVLTGDAKPRSHAEHAAFLATAFEPGDVFDFSNPIDVAEFERLCRKPRAKKQ